VLSRPILALAIALWTVLSWGGRIRLLTAAEQDVSTWLRIGGSLLIGLLAAATLLLFQGGVVERWLLTLFAAWSTVLWLRSLVSVWAGDNSLAFKLVHTVLAVGFFVLAYLAARTAWSPRSA